MKKFFGFFLFVFVSICFAEVPYIDSGYLNLSDPMNWNDYYVVYMLTTDNSKGGKSTISFVEDSFDKVLQIYQYDSKDYFQLDDQSSELFDQVYIFNACLTPGTSFNEDSEEFKQFETLRVSRFEFEDNPNADSIIEKEFDLAKENAKKTYHQTIENYNKLTQNQKDLLGDWFQGSSGLTVTWKRFVDSHEGYFVFEVYQKETETVTYFRVYDDTTVYFKTTDDSNKRKYNTLDEKVLVVCSEIPVNTKIRFGILKSNNLKDYKDVGFIIIIGE